MVSLVGSGAVMMENPMDHTMEWHHGSPTSFKRPVRRGQRG